VLHGMYWFWKGNQDNHQTRVILYVPGVFVVLFTFIKSHLNFLTITWMTYREPLLLVQDK
jgi:hypothetical protein